MALTTEQIDSAYRKVWSTVPHAQRLSAFALEIEAEVRKQDEPLTVKEIAEFVGTHEFGPEQLKWFRLGEAAHGITQKGGQHGTE